MKATNTVEYAIRGVLYLAEQPDGRKVLLSEIAEIQDVPKNFLGKIFQMLVKAQILRSYKGSNGGFILNRPKNEITVRMIIEAVEGPLYLNHCLVRKGECCNDVSCRMHRVWQEAQKGLLATLDRYTVEDLVQSPGTERSAHANAE